MARPLATHKMLYALPRSLSSFLYLLLHLSIYSTRYLVSSLLRLLDSLLPPPASTLFTSISSRCLMVFHADAPSSLAAAAEFDTKAIATNRYPTYSDSSVSPHPSRIVGGSGKGSRSPSSSMADRKFTGSASTPGSSSSSGGRFVAWVERRRSIPPPHVVVRGETEQWWPRVSGVRRCRRPRPAESSS